MIQNRPWRHSVHRLKEVVRLVSGLCHSTFIDGKLLAALEPHVLQILVRGLFYYRSQVHFHPAVLPTKMVEYSYISRARF